MCLSYTSVLALLEQTSTRIKLNKADKKRKYWQSITHFRFFLFYVMANLFHGVLDKSLCNEFSFAG